MRFSLRRDFYLAGVQLNREMYYLL